MKNALILLAGGSGKRFAKSKKITPKQFIRFGKYNFIEYFLKNLDDKIFDKIHIIVSRDAKKKYLSKITKEFSNHKISFYNAGKTRQESSKKGIYSFKKFNPKKILIHDSARPLVSNKLIRKLLKSINNNKSCSPYIRSNDFVKKLNTKENVTNDKIIHIQTPQAFKYLSILKAHKISKIKNARDDTSLTENIGIKTKLIKGEKTNIKITYKDEIEIFNKLKKIIYKHGIGYDIHKVDFFSKKQLKLCGVKIASYPLIGHSDADVGYHAICDSILGSLSMRDIGFYFNNKNKKWKNANSKIFLLFCKKQLEFKGFSIVNLDINFICEKPKINKYVNKMKKNISNLLNLNQNQISIKATTNEKIGLIGKGKGIAAESIVQITNE